MPLGLGPQAFIPSTVETGDWGHKVKACLGITNGFKDSLYNVSRIKSKNSPGGIV